MRPSSTWLVRVLVLLVGLVVVPVSLAAVRPDDKGGQQGPGAAAAVVVTASPNDQARVIGVGSVSAASEPYASFEGERDLGLFRSDGSIVVPSTPVAVEQPTGTDWGAIVTGVGIVAVAALVTLAVVEVTRQHGGPAKPVPH